ncbi:MAG: serine hydrolase [Caldilineaceae bacterium]
MRRLITFIICLVAVLALFRLYTRFKVIAAPIPPGVYLGGLELSDLKDPAEIRQHLEGVYNQTIEVDFGDTQLPLRPQEVDFQLDVATMVKEAKQYLDGPPFIDIAIRAALGFPQQRRDIRVRFTLNQAKLRAWLENAALEHNSTPIGAHALPPLAERTSISATAISSATVTSDLANRAWRWAPGIPGYTLDVEKSMPPVVAALARDENRVAKLVLTEIPPSRPSMTDLTEVVSNTLGTFPGFAAVYVRDLQHGDEANVDGEVAFSGMATIKLALMAAAFAQLKVEDPAIAQAIGQMLAEDDNATANQLLTLLGHGDQNAGAQSVTDFVRKLGLNNTYLQGGFNVPPLPPLSTPANQRTDWNTKPDPNLQTTPVDLGRLLAAIYECTEGKGVLVASNPDRFARTTCRQMLTYVAQDQLQALLWLGLPNPKDRWVVHQQGIADQTQGDVALIWGPTGPYVIAVFLYQGGWLDRQVSSATMQQVSRLVWDFFDLQKNQGEVSAGAPPSLTPFR